MTYPSISMIIAPGRQSITWQKISIIFTVSHGQILFFLSFMIQFYSSGIKESSYLLYIGRFIKMKTESWNNIGLVGFGYQIDCQYGPNWNDIFELYHKNIN